MGVGQGDHMVYIQFASAFDDDPRVGGEPPTAYDDAFPAVGEPHRTQGFIYQDFCPRILAVSVGVNPSSPVLAVIRPLLARQSDGKPGDSDDSIGRSGNR